ncbi:MAG: phospholipase D-like domain-containing protein, partial [Thermodesulfovibrionales bacterium]
TVLLVFYIFKNDDTGTQLAGILKKKASEGVRVCVLYDHFGSIFTPHSFWMDLRNDGVEVRASRPFKWKAIGDYIHRDHRKLIVIDGKVAFTGGLNIADEYRGHGLMRHKKGGWRDTAIKLEGPVAGKLHDIFSKTWLFWKGDPIDIKGSINGLSADKGLKVITIFSSSSRGRKSIRKLLYWCIRNAKQSICLTTAYFTPSRRMMFVLREAVQRGVKVRLLLPGFSDMKAVMYAGRASFSELLKWGVDIYLYRESVLHAKSYMFDGVFCVIGSANLDFQSLRKNDEGNIGVYDEGFAGEMEVIFNRDIERSKKIEFEEWIKRPLLKKILEKFFVMFRRRL